MSNEFYKDFSGNNAYKKKKKEEVKGAVMNMGR